MAMVLSVPVQAAEWTAEPDISLRSGYNDNVLLDTGPHTSVWETNLIASSKFGVAKENQGLFGDAGSPFGVSRVAADVKVATC